MTELIVFSVRYSRENIGYTWYIPINKRKSSHLTINCLMLKNKLIKIRPAKLERNN